MSMLVQLRAEYNLVLARGRLNMADSRVLEQVLRFTGFSTQKRRIRVSGEAVTSISRKALRKLRKLTLRAMTEGVELTFEAFPPSFKESITAVTMASEQRIYTLPSVTAGKLAGYWRTFQAFRLPRSFTY